MDILLCKNTASVTVRQEMKQLAILMLEWGVATQ